VLFPIFYGRTGYDTANFLNAPEKFVSKNTHYEFSIEQAITHKSVIKTTFLLYHAAVSAIAGG